MNLRQAAQQALEALMKSHTHPLLPDDCEAAITALRAALAEPEQEPVAWVWPSELEKVKQPGQGRRASIRAFCSPELPGLKGLSGLLPLYTAPTPRKWVSLTEQEMYDLFFNDQYGPRLPQYLVNTIKCVEAALKEKNNG